MSETAKNQAWHRQNKREIKRLQHAAERAELAELQRKISELKHDRKALVCRAKNLCRSERAKIRAAGKVEIERIRAMRLELKTRRSSLGRRMREARERARKVCRLRTEAGRHAHAEALSELAAHKAEHKELLELLRRSDRLKPKRSTAAERRSESDDQVRQNIPAELVEVFDSVRSQIRNKPGRSRTEAFLEWVEAHPDSVWTVKQASADRDLKRLLAEEKRQQVKLRKTRRSLDALEAAPF